ncbi:tyrosine-type recombinase/integrase [Paraclostridium bifermentans]|uniref:tyrosine-type recombinase/integrase n=1 Tax=Paraclostridium bifermentans TaxID=1490 RepID=UPI0024304F80|nr:tyrosine-type recombinase/integrase [Paraclostridium bifermentans]
MTLTKILGLAYRNYNRDGQSDFYYENALRDIAVIELLFATGLIVSELCNIKQNDINLKEKYIKVYGKGAKERYIQLTNSNVISALKKYQSKFLLEIKNTNNYFINNRGNKLSEKSVRIIVNKFAKLCESDIHITPYMFSILLQHYFERKM